MHDKNTYTFDRLKEALNKKDAKRILYGKKKPKNKSNKYSK